MIAKEKVVERLTSRDSELFKKWEAVIDRALSSTTTLPVYIDIRSGDDSAYSIVEVIKREYGKTGWKVEYISDQRDGDCLKFE